MLKKKKKITGRIWGPHKIEGKVGRNRLGTERNQGNSEIFISRKCLLACY